MIQCVGRSRGEALHRPVKHPPSVLLAQDQRGTLIADVFPVPMPPRALAATGGDVVNGPSPRGWGEPAVLSRECSRWRTIPTRVGRTSHPRRRTSKGADHPHAGGENHRGLDQCQTSVGPSPRGWGERARSRRWSSGSRTIPTRVGRTSRMRWRVSAPADHPHAGGENSAPKLRDALFHGPSPRGWGEQAEWQLASSSTRTIPTRVGRTAVRVVRPARMADHPHAGGENRNADKNPLWISGPSPRGWGEQEKAAQGQSERRTIPTRVGRTAPVLSPQAPRPDHPHAGGENDCIHAKAGVARGPSPRGWGERDDAVRQIRCQRTIPTRVGRTDAPIKSVSFTADHPHAGGENLPATPAARQTRGPSPRGWGEPARACAGLLRRRTIPTRVGRTRCSAQGLICRPDHPHAGGENTPAAQRKDPAVGPSPRGWGERLEFGLYECD